MILTDLSNEMKNLWEKTSFHKHFKAGLRHFSTCPLKIDAFGFLKYYYYANETYKKAIILFVLFYITLYTLPVVQLFLCRYIIYYAPPIDRETEVTKT